MTHDAQNALLTAVNTPYQNHFDAAQLAHAIGHGEITSGQVSSFFTEVSVEAQKAFAQNMGISDTTLIKTAAKVTSWSGQTIALIA